MEMIAVTVKSSTSVKPLMERGLECGWLGLNKVVINCVLEKIISKNV